MPEPLVGEPNLVSLFIGEAPNAGLHHQIPFRKVYRAVPHINNALSLDSTVSLAPVPGPEA